MTAAFPLQPIHLPNLAQHPDGTRTWEINDPLPGLETLTPVQGRMVASHRGNFLEVSADVETIVTLSCDRCLCNYNHRLVVEAREIIWLQAPREDFTPGMEEEVEFDELVETLPPDGDFDPAQWLYEQCCLALPAKSVCNPDCEGIPVPEEAAPDPTPDHRWAALQQLRDQLNP
jgi:uncharacterized protein